jgi:hypothetical protein
MKLKAPQGVGDPCVAGVIVHPRDGVYEVEPEIGALLIECFGFVEIATSKTEPPKLASPARRGRSAARKA